MKIPPVGAELFRADRRTDMTELIVAFQNFGNAPTKEKRHWACGRYIKQSKRHGILRGCVKGVVTKFWPAVCLFIVAYNSFASGLSGPNFGI